MPKVPKMSKMPKINVFYLFKFSVDKHKIRFYVFGPLSSDF